MKAIIALVNLLRGGIRMIKNCEKCKEKFHTSDRGDTLCCHCDGSMPRLQYTEIDTE